MGAYVGGKKILDLSRATIRGNADFNGGNLTNIGTLQGTTITVGAKSVVGYQNYVEADPATLVVSKDVERKFFKDDFSVDSSSQYTGDVASFTWDTANKKLVCTNPATTKSIETAPVNIYGCYEFPLKWHTNTAGTAVDCRINIGYVDASNYYSIYIYIASDYSYINPKINRVGTTLATGGNKPYVEGAILKIVVTSTGINVYYNGSLVRTYSGTIASVNGTIQFIAGKGHTTECYGITYAPSISYSDDFTTDTVSGLATITLLEVA